MNAAQIHLGLNHLPVGLVLVGTPLLAVALLRKSSELKTTACALLVLSALSAVPTYLSGEPAEKLVDHRPGISNAMEEHEEAGEIALVVIGVLGALTLGGWVFEKRKRPLPNGIWWGLVLLGSLSLGGFIRAAHLGGLIRHEEISGKMP